MTRYDSRGREQNFEMYRPFLAFAILLIACQTADPMAEMDLPRISLTSDGGISGRGVGSVSVDQGEVTAGSDRKTCHATITDGERHELSKLTDISEYKPSGFGSPDEVRYTLSVGSRTATWYGELPPKSIRPLVTALWKIRQRVLATC